MPRLSVFVVADEKIARVSQEAARLREHMRAHDRAAPQSEWARTAAMALAVHGIYTGLEDVMTDLARTIDGHVPEGALSHQNLLYQMRADMDGRRPALLDDELYEQLVELKAFRHFVRHQYGVDLRPDKTQVKAVLVQLALDAFKNALARLEAALTQSD